MAKLSDLIKENDLKPKAEQIRLAEHFYKLSQDLEKAKENPVLKAVANLEKNRKDILDNLTNYDSETLQEKMNKLKLDFSNPLFQSAIANTQIADSIANSTRIKDLINLQYSLKPEYSATQKAIESFQKTLSNPLMKNSIIGDNKLKSYKSKIDKISEDISKNQNLFESSKGLASLGQEIAGDSLEFKLNEQAKLTIPEIVKRDYVPIKIPKNPMVGQNEEIIGLLGILQEQNNTLIQFEKSNQEVQKSSIELTNKIQTNNEIMIEELKAQNKNLETQLSQKEKEITQNRKNNSFTRKIAIWGIGISIVVGIVSSIVPFYISNQEKLENDKDNKKLLEVISNKSVENENMALLLKEIQLQNKINENLENNQIKLIKVLETQNEYFKNRDKK